MASRPLVAVAVASSPSQRERSVQTAHASNEELAAKLETDYRNLVQKGAALNISENGSQRQVQREPEKPVARPPVQETREQRVPETPVGRHPLLGQGSARAEAETQSTPVEESPRAPFNYLSQLRGHGQSQKNPEKSEQVSDIQPARDEPEAKPTLTKFEILQQQIKQSNLAPKLEPEHPVIPSSTKVYITHVSNAVALYVLAVEDQDEFQKILLDVSKHGAAEHRVPDLEFSPLDGSVYFAAPLDGGGYGRATLIKKPSGGHVKIGLIDHGYVMELPTSALRVLPDELIMRRRLPRKIVLDDSAFDGHPNKDDYLRKMSDAQQEFILTYQGEFDLRTTKCDLVLVKKIEEIKPVEVVVPQPVTQHSEREQMKDTEKKKQSVC